MAFEWVAGLFQSEQTRGLSGDNAGSVALDDSNPYYNYRLRRHKAEGDLIADPGLIWYTSPYVKRRTGLGTHVAAEVGEGVANYTDILLVLSQEDHARATAKAGSPEAGWLDQATGTLGQEFENFCQRESFRRPHDHRPLSFRVLCDGSPEMGGKNLGLQRGEFITGLLPNLYTGPVETSRPVIGVHVNLPGIWEGYREVGRLYNDQILFTLGNYWLDNFSHPSLLEAALYRLQQYPDGSFVHIINPDLQDRYQVTSTNQGGASVLTLATRDGQPLAYIVLAVIDAEEEAPAPRPSPSRPDIRLPSAPKPAAKESARDSIPSVAPPMLIDDELQPVASKSGKLGGKTIIPDAPSERIFTFQERGALLQKVHFSAFMLGYDVYVSARGELGTVVEAPAATFQVRKRHVAFVAHVDGVTIDGAPVPPSVETLLEASVVIEVAGQRFEYRDLRGLDIEGWPYVAEIRRPASSTYMIWGEEYQIGRSRECRVVLPDEPRNDNIHWKPSVGDGATIRARTGDIPKSNFYTDSIMVASKHAAIDLQGEAPKVVCSATHCFVYVRRGGEVVPLWPTSRGKLPLELEVEPGDEVLIGNCLFHVGYTPAGEAVAPSPAPKVELSADSLVDAVEAPDFETPAAARPRRNRPSPSQSPEEAPSAYGLGERGVRPPPVDVERVGMDSILGFNSEELEQAAPARLDQMSALPEPGDDEPTLSFEGEASDGPPPPPDAPPPPPEEPPPPMLYEDVAGEAEDELDLDDDLPEDATETVALPDAPPSADAPPPLPADAPPPLPADAPPPLPASEPPPLPSDDAPPPLPGDDAFADAPPPPPADVPPPLTEEVEVSPPPASEPPPLPEAPTPVETGEAAPAVETGEAAPAVETGEAAPAVETGEAAPVEEPADEAPAEVSAPAGQQVVFTDDSEAQFELGRPLHLVLAGWMVNGDVVCGNHTGADLILPENRIVEDQTFEACDYFRLQIRGRRGELELLAPTELLIDEDDPGQTVYDDPDQHTIDVIRRDDRGDEDFAVRLTIVQDRKLPDPRARFIAIDTEDPLAAALITRGLPKGAPRTLEIGGMSLTVLFDGETVRVSDYLATYRRSDGFHPFFVQRDGARFKTAPEDGSPFDLSDGDRLVIGQEVYVLREE